MVRFQLYLISDGESHPASHLEAALAAVPKGGVAIQLRNRRLAGLGLFRLAEQFRMLTARQAAPLFINDRLDVALAVQADGIHLPGHGLQPKRVRDLVGNRLLISAASHSLKEAQALFAGGADCVTFGPIWPTPSKPAALGLADADRVSPLGPAALAAAVAALPAPVFALGGIDSPERAAACAAAGARVACLRAVLGAPDPAAAAAAFFGATRRLF